MVQGLRIIEDSWSHSDTPHSVGLLWTSDKPDAVLTIRNNYKETDIHASGGIRTRNPRKRAAADPRLRPRGHWERPGSSLLRTICERTKCDFRVKANFFSRRHTRTDSGANRPESEVNRYYMYVQVQKWKIRGCIPPFLHVQMAIKLRLRNLLYLRFRSIKQNKFRMTIRKGEDTVWRKKL